jgi:hypothetical protein
MRVSSSVAILAATNEGWKVRLRRAKCAGSTISSISNTIIHFSAGCPGRIYVGHFLNALGSVWTQLAQLHFNHVRVRLAGRQK